MVYPLVVTNHYRTEQEQLAFLQNGVLPQVARDIGSISDLDPGIINIIYHCIDIQLKEPRKEKKIYISKKKKSLIFFYAILKSKRNRHDGDVKWSVMGIDTTIEFFWAGF